MNDKRQLLREKGFRRYWTGSTISMFGDQITGVALPLAAVLVLHAHAAQMGILTALQWLPSLLFGMHAGALADRRGHRRRAMITADLGRAALLGTVPACYALHVLTLPQLYLVTFAVGTLAVSFNVCDGTLFVSIVDEPRYMAGQSLLYGSRALSFVGGPSVAGVLVQVLGAPFTIIADALSFVGSAFFLSRIRPAEPAAAPEEGSVTDGMRFVFTDPIVRASLTGVAVINFFNLMYSALFMLYAVRVLGIRPGVLGLILGGAAIGSVLGALATSRAATRIGVGMTYVGGSFIFTLPLLLVPLARPGLPHSLVLMMLLCGEFGCGFGVMMLDISIGTIFAEVIPDRVRSRVSGAFQAVNYGTRPAGALLGGLLGTVLGLRAGLWIATVGGLCGAALLIPSPLPRYKSAT